MSTMALSLDGVSVSRGGRTVVDRVTTSLPAGRIAAVVGPNGSGKSTLLGAVAGMLPHAGAVHWGGRRPASAELAYMPQSTTIRAGLSVLEVVLLGRIERLRWRLADADLSAAESALAALDLTHLAERRIDTLSGGQQQLVLLAQRLVRRPSLVLLDEPTSALDLSRQLLALDILATYARETGALVLVALHDLSLAARYASTLMLLNQGTLVDVGSPADVLRPDAIRSAYDIESEILRTAAGHLVIAPLRASAPSNPASNATGRCHDP